MVTSDELFTFVIMLCAVITLVIDFKRKKQRPLSGKLRRYLLLSILYAKCTEIAILKYNSPCWLVPNDEPDTSQQQRQLQKKNLLYEHISHAGKVIITHSAMEYMPKYRAEHG